MHDERERLDVTQARSLLPQAIDDVGTIEQLPDDVELAEIGVRHARDQALTLREQRLGRGPAQHHLGAQVTRQPGIGEADLPGEVVRHLPGILLANQGHTRNLLVEQRAPKPVTLGGRVLVDAGFAHDRQEGVPLGLG